MKASSKTWTRGFLVMGMMTALNAKADPPPENGAQGTRLHGSERFENVNIPLGSIEPSAPPAGMRCGEASAQMKDGLLVGDQACEIGNAPAPRSLKGPGLVGTSFRAPFEGRSVKLTIEEARCHDDITTSAPHCTAQDAMAGQALWEYRVTASPEDSQPQPLCPHGSGYALAVPHAWSVGGELIPNSEYFTFACAPANKGSDGAFFVGGGVIAKCIDWGYPPWATGYYPNASVASSYHQLCTRMAMADYCGEGRSNTLDGTPLLFMGAPDAASLGLGGGLPPATYKGYALEAVWQEDKCGGVRPLCLSKKRWDTLPLEATCVDSSHLRAAREARPCEELDLDHLPPPDNERLLVSYSFFVDRSLVLFKDADNRYVTTTAVTVDRQKLEGSGVDGIHLDMDGDGVADVTHLLPQRKEGPILSPGLPVNILDRMGSFIRPLFRCLDTAGHSLLTDDKDCEDAPDYSARVIEGYVYSAVDATSAGQRRPLKLWVHPVLGVYATSTQAPDGFTFVRDLGYLPAVGQLPGRDL